MKKTRRRPRQHWRRIKTKKGRRRILINKGIRPRKKVKRKGRDYIIYPKGFYKMIRQPSIEVGPVKNWENQPEMPEKNKEEIDRQIRRYNLMKAKKGSMSTNAKKILHENVRRIKTKKGRKKILINKGIKYKSKRERNYGSKFTLKDAVDINLGKRYGETYGIKNRKKKKTKLLKLIGTGISDSGILNVPETFALGYTLNLIPDEVEYGGKKSPNQKDKTKEFSKHFGIYRQ